MSTPYDFDHPLTDGFIRTWPSMSYVDLLNPDVDMIRLEDIAHALSQTCRFGGHVARFYSVAEHSIWVSQQVHRTFGDPLLSFAALLHDAAEAYLGDIVRPLKHLPTMTVYREVEGRMERVIEEAFGLAPFALSGPTIKAIDTQILPWEMAMIRDSRGRTPTPCDEVALEYRERARDLHCAAFPNRDKPRAMRGWV